MVNETTMTAALLQGAATTVGEFGSLIVLVVGLGIGFFVVSYIIRKAKGARR